PASHATFARQTQQTAKPLHQRIFTKIVQMIEPSATDQHQNHDHQDHVDGPVVSSHIILSKHRPHTTPQVDQPKIAPDQLQSAKGCDVLGSKFNLKKTLAR